MASKLTDVVLKIIAQNATAPGLDAAAKGLDSLAGKAEDTAQRMNRSFKTVVPPDVQRRAAVAASLGQQRGREEAQQRADVARRNSVAFGLAEQRRREEVAQRMAAGSLAQKRIAISESLTNQRVSEAQRRSNVAFSLAEQKRAELAANPSFFKGLAGDVGGVAKGLAGLGGSVLTGVVSGVVSASLSTVLNTITSAATKVITSGLDAVREGAAKALEQGILREDAEVSFGALLGNRDRGKALVDKLQGLAIDTPFSSRELFDQSKLLLSYGLANEKLIPVLRQLGDVASGAGVDLNRLSLAYGQVLAKGRLQGGELRQFTEAGVGVGDFAAAFRDLTGRQVSVNQFLKLSEAGEVSSKVVERAFERMTTAGGRFFGLMEDRSRTFGGRLQALRESIDTFAGKVGKSFIDNTSTGNFFDRASRSIQGIDTKSLDSFFRLADGTVGSALGRAGRGFGGALGLSQVSVSNFDFDALDDRLRALTETTIPSILDAGRDLSAAFLNVGATVLRFASLLDHLIPEDKVNQTARELAEQQRINAEEVAAGRKPALFRERALRENLEAFTKERADRAAALAAQGRIDPLNVADTLDRNAAALRRTTPGADFRNAAKLPSDVLDGIIGRKNNRLLQGGLDIVGKVFSDPANLRNQAEAARLNALNRERFKSGEIGERLPSLTGVDVGKVPAALDFLSTAIKDRTKGLRDAFDRITDGALPDFAKRAEELTARLAKPEEGKPYTDFMRNLGTINQLDSDLARSLGLGISKADGRRLRGELGQEVLARFKPAEIQPPPLIRAGSQESEAALTRAIYEARNANRKPEEELRDALDQLREEERRATEQARRVADALEGFGQANRDPFNRGVIAIGLGL